MSLNKIKKRELILFGAHSLIFGGVLQKSVNANNQRCIDDAFTPEQVEGPFFLPGAPETRKLSMAATDRKIEIKISGKILNKDCRPLQNASINFWHASPEGYYDSKGFRYRGFQKARSDGSYDLVTDIPGKYVGRTPHIHVKIRASKSELTTQLYFPNQPSNDSDYFFDKKLQMQNTSQGFIFDFILG